MKSLKKQVHYYPRPTELFFSSPTAGIVLIALSIAELIPHLTFNDVNYDALPNRPPEGQISIRIADLSSNFLIFAEKIPQFLKAAEWKN